MQGYDGSPAWAEAFIERYADFLVNLTLAHGSQSLPIFCGAGPMNHTYGPFVHSAIQLARDRGVVGAKLVKYTAMLDGCGNHPGRIGHWQMFESLKPLVAETMGW